ncbi:hypothetical protein ABC795_04935 [Blastococcus sp. HT6-30]|uniref:hypothetical protein n=1 Tax=Blastococcus sp. HT6-30 TaxID=3144843 RepID=UPI00321A1ADC
MTSSATPTTTRPPAAMVRAAAVHSPATAASRGRHRAPELGSEAQVADDEQLHRRGRHAEPEEAEEADSPDRPRFSRRRD